MKEFKAILKRELASYFATPIALIFLVVFIVLNGVFTFKLGNFFEIGQADLRSFFSWHPWLYLFIAPAVSMRLWAEERKSGTIELLLTLPVNPFEAMLAKFFASWIFLALALALTFPMILTVCYLGDPDLGVIAGGYLGSLVMAGTYLAIGCAVSALTKNQVISFVISTTVCLFFILLGFEPVVNGMLGFLPQGIVNQISGLSIPIHFDAIQRGVVDLKDFIYFVSLILFFLFAGTIALDRSKAD
jgi:ABC-2 type transport system permease protein